MQMPWCFPFMPRYLGVRHQLKSDIFLTSVRQSWTELLEGAAIWILGKQVIKSSSADALLTGKLILFCAIIESAQSSQTSVNFYLYTQYCWISSVAFSLLRSYCLTCYFFCVCCVGHMSIGITLYQKPRRVML